MAAGVRLLGRSVSPKMPVVFIPGTCDYKGRSMPEVAHDGRCEAARYPNLHLLDEETLRLGDVLFVGATLWSDLNVFGDQRQAIDRAQRSKNYKEIKTSGKPRKRFSPRQSIRLHERAKLFIEHQLSRSRGLTSVVVTHHAPSLQSIPPSYFNDPLAATYASSLERLILTTQPDLWVHGGICGLRRYPIGDTMVVANPRGFDGIPYGETIDVGEFTAELVLDIGGKSRSYRPRYTEETRGRGHVASIPPRERADTRLGG
jgi:hypothetical protein